ncbi:MAG: DUF2934 domain-containing protein [Nitrospirota bacterium]
MSRQQSASAPHDFPLHVKITERAYQLFEQRGRVHGHHVEDWLRAEQEIKAAWGRSPASPRANAAPNGHPRPRLKKAA